MATATQQPAQPHQATASGSSFDETAATASPQARTAASPVTEDHRQEADDGDHATEDEEDDPPRYAHFTHHPKEPWPLGLSKYCLGIWEFGPIGECTPILSPILAYFTTFQKLRTWPI